MTLLERPSDCELELGLLTQCAPISFTGPHHTLVWQGWCCDSEYGPAGSRHVYWDLLGCTLSWVTWSRVLRLPVLCQETAYPDIAGPQWCHIPRCRLSSYSAPHRHTMGTMIQVLPQLTSCVGVMETHKENGLQSGAQTQEFPRKTPLFSSLETPWRVFGQLWAVIFVAGKSSREDRHPKGL